MEKIQKKQKVVKLTLREPSKKKLVLKLTHPKKEETEKPRTNKWVSHVKKLSEKTKLPYGEALRVAKKSYLRG